MNLVNTAPDRGRRLDAWFRQAFDGNGIAQQDITLKDRHASDNAVEIRIDLRLDWDWSWTTVSGAFHPDNAIHCQNVADLDSRLRKSLNETVADIDEAKALARQWSNGSSGLLVFDKPTFQVRPIETRWYCHQGCNTCRASGRMRCHHCLYGKQKCTSCFGKGHHVLVSPNSNRSSYPCAPCWGAGEYNCSYCFGSCLLDCTNCDATGWFTTTKQAQITAKMTKAITGLGADSEGFIKAVQALSIESIAPQGDVVLENSHAGKGEVSLLYTVVLPHLHHTYFLGGRELAVHAVGNDLLVPHMPPILDDVIEPVVARIVDAKATPQQVLRAAEDCRVTQEILEIIGSQPRIDATAIARSFNNCLSADKVTSIAAAITVAYDGVAAPGVKQIWIRSAVVLNSLIALAIMLGVLNPLARSFVASDVASTSHAMAFCVAIIGLASTWFMARRAGLNEVKQATNRQLTRPPAQGWPPIAVCLATILIAVLLIKMDSGRTGQLVSISKPIGASPALAGR